MHDLGVLRVICSTLLVERVKQRDSRGEKRWWQAFAPGGFCQVEVMTCRVYVKWGFSTWGRVRG